MAACYNEIGRKPTKACLMTQDKGLVEHPTGGFWLGRNTREPFAQLPRRAVPREHEGMLPWVIRSPRQAGWRGRF